ncbi:hypothetical protein OG730_03545 [Streptomyces sp. NBC_01298]|uniref:hypothetical protein n=1 Tax=Streptomyces sp. NBC_01298 TaxID=2903817 RepID=UPI002E11E433|nr:hypothetical protein OG730_03545 [Streptomyces sp. NBC_01298]
MQPIRPLRRASAVVAGVVAVLLLVCGGLFTHPAFAGHAAGARSAGTARTAGIAGMPAMVGMSAMAEPPAMDAMDGPPAMAGMHAIDRGPESAAAGTAEGSGSEGGCSASGQDCPLASAYAPTVPAGPAGDLAGSAIWGTQSVVPGHPGPAPSPERSRPRAPDLDSLCVSRT